MKFLPTLIAGLMMSTAALASPSSETTNMDKVAFEMTAAIKCQTIWVNVARLAQALGSDDVTDSQRRFQVSLQIIAERVLPLAAAAGQDPVSVMRMMESGFEQMDAKFLAMVEKGNLVSEENLPTFMTLLKSGIDQCDAWLRTHGVEITQ